jgi:hypothetical protein
MISGHKTLKTWLKISSYLIEYLSLSSNLTLPTLKNFLPGRRTLYAMASQYRTSKLFGNGSWLGCQEDRRVSFDSDAVYDDDQYITYLDLAFPFHCVHHQFFVSRVWQPFWIRENQWGLWCLRVWNMDWPSPIGALRSWKTKPLSNLLQYISASVVTSQNEERVEICNRPDRNYTNLMGSRNSSLVGKTRQQHLSSTPGWYLPCLCLCLVLELLHLCTPDCESDQKCQLLHPTN